MNRGEQIKDFSIQRFGNVGGRESQYMLAKVQACMFFELGWRAADESMIDKCCDLVDEFEDKFKKEMAKCL